MKQFPTFKEIIRTHTFLIPQHANSLRTNKSNKVSNIEKKITCETIQCERIAFASRGIGN